MLAPSRHFVVLLALLLVALAPSLPATARTEAARTEAARAVLAATAPATVKPGTPITIAGIARVRNRTPREVRLFEKAGSTWVLRAHKRSGPAGRVQFAVKGTAALRARQFQLRVRRTVRLAAATSKVLAVRVATGNPPTTRPPAPLSVLGLFDLPAPLPATEPRPVGSVSDWSRLFETDIARWNPCAVITWAYNPNLERYPALADAKKAVSVIAARSGLRFRYVGATTGRAGAGGTFPAGVGIVIAWAGPSTVQSFAAGSVGEGGAYGRTSAAGDGYVLTQGYVLLNRTSGPAPGFTGPAPSTWGQILIHELLHAIGLGHAAGPGQLMYPKATTANRSFGAGDLTGLAEVGSTHGCWT